MAANALLVWLRSWQCSLDSPADHQPHRVDLLHGQAPHQGHARRGQPGGRARDGVQAGRVRSGAMARDHWSPPGGPGPRRRTIRERRPGRARGAGRMNVHEMLQNPDEHVRFAAYLDKLGHVADPDEVDRVGSVLTDPDQTMAQSAVLRHLDRRAAGLYPGPPLRGVGAGVGPGHDRPSLPGSGPAGVVSLPRRHAQAALAAGRPARGIQLAPAQDRRRDEHRGPRDPRRSRPHQTDPGLGEHRYSRWR